MFTLSRKFGGSRARRESKRAQGMRRGMSCEELEKRTLLSFPPAPVVPAPGESQILQNALRFARNQQFQPWDNQPMPFAVVGTNLTTGAVNIVRNNPNSSSQMRVDIDVDSNPSTGKGGKDLSVGVSTELFFNGVLNPHLLATYDRLGTAPFATNFEVLVSFPFSAFAPEFFGTPSTIPDPNLFMGYKTFAATSTGPTNGPGGIAPLKEQIRFIPNTMLGANHPLVQIQLATTGDVNPLQFLTGYFSAAAGSGLAGIQDAAAYAAWVQSPPDTAAIGVTVANSFPLGTPLSGSINLTWDASSRSKVVFDYLEEESGALSDSDFNTTVSFDLMPTHEELSLTINEGLSSFTLSHDASHVIDTVTILSQRNDGLEIIGTLTDIPTQVDVTVDLDGSSAVLDVNANTMDGLLEIKKDGGFLDTDEFLGYDLGYVAVGMTDVPDLFIGYDPSDDSVGVHTIDPTECIGSISLVIGDDDDLELPPPQDDLGGVAPWDDPNRHVFSLIDDGTHGTAAARLVHVQTAQLNLDAADIAELFTFTFCEAAPLTAYLRTTEDSNLIPDHDVEVTINVNDIPAGTSTFTMDPPTDFKYDLPFGAEIDSIHAFGHIDCTFFDFLAGDLPNKLEFSFDPDGAISLLAQNSSGGPDRVGVIAVRLWHEEIPGFVCPDDSLLPGSPLPNLLGDELQEARLRLDDIPSFQADWSDDANTTHINFDTDAAIGSFAFLGGVQVAVSTAVDLTPLVAATLGADHYLTFRDQGSDVSGSLPKQLKAGAFGINSFTYDSDDANATYALSYRADETHRLVVTFDSAPGGRYLPQFDTLLTFTITSVPDSFDFVADLDPGFRYSASAPISSITLTGTVDDIAVNFSFITLPSLVRFSLEADELKVIDGLLDINADDAVNGSDDGVAGGVTVIDGKLDMNFDGAITAADDDTFLGAGIIDGGIDINLDAAVDGNDDGALAGLELKMNGNVSSINLSLNSPTSIFGTPYELFQAAINTVPAHTLASWAGKKILVETKNAGGAPLALGSLTALLSTENDTPSINTKLEPFTTGEGGARVNYSPFLQEIDDRYNNAGSPSVGPRLDELYGQAQVLNTGEDHLVGRVVGDTLDIASFQFTGFQKLLIDPETDGGTYEFRKPVPGISPFFVGVGVDDVFGMLQIDNIPDLMRLVTNTEDHDITFHVEDDAPPPEGSLSHIGDIDIYAGQGTTAGDSDLAARIIMKDVPDDVHIFWDFGFPSGSANFDASNEFELLFLAQDGGNRLVGGLQLEDLQAGYNVAFDPHFSVGTTYYIPTSLDLVILTATAGIDNDVNFDGGGNPIIGANGSKPGVDGFFTLYNMETDPESLTDGDGNAIGPAPGDDEYVPGFSFLMKDFQEFSLQLDAGVHLFPAFLVPFIDDHGGPTLVGQFVLDFWAPEVDISTDLFGGFGFFNRADYRDNTPIHLIPLGTPDFDVLHDAVFTFVGFHDFDDHIDPFA